MSENSPSVTPMDTMALNAKLQQKKNKLRRDLESRGVLPKGAMNSFDKYKYFSEAQYKELFTQLFSKHGLELKADTLDMEEYGGTDKQPQGRRVTVEFTLMDIETGYGETSRIIGEGLDKGDKALYKAYTGALKYYYAENFSVATGDEVETDSPEYKGRAKKETSVTEVPTPKELEDFALGYQEDEQRRIRGLYNATCNAHIPVRAMRNYIRDRLPLIEEKRKKELGIADDPREFF